MTTKISKQRLLLEYLVSSPDTFALCKTIVKSAYFDPEYRKTVDFIHTYYDNYSSTPDSVQIEAETGLELNERQITRDQIEYCSTEIEKFCRRKAIEAAVLSSPPLIEKGDYGLVETMIKDAVSISLNKDLGLDYFADPTGRLERLKNEPPRTTTKWPAFDEAIGGGLERTELLLFTANSGGGKSIALANLSLNFASQGFNVLYISLELSETMISQRFDMMFTGIPTVIWRENATEIAVSLNQIAPHMGKIIIKRMPSGTTAHDIRGYLKDHELKNEYMFDLLVVDYIDIMGANEKVSADNVHAKDKMVSEQVRDILEDYRMFGASASQQNRGAIEAVEVHQGHIAGGISKVNTCDIHCSILMTPVMKAAGEIGFVFLKTRSSDGVGKTIYLVWDNNSLRILNPKKDCLIDGDGVITERVAKAQVGKRKSLETMLTI